MDILAITIPIFVLLASGYIARKKGLIGDETKNFLSKTVYYVAFPALTFRSIVSFDFASTFRLNLVGLNVLVTTTIALVTFVLVFAVKNARKRGAFHMCCFRSNQGYMGLPIINGFYGEAAMSRAAIINGFDSCLVIILSVLALEVYRGKGAKDGKSKTALRVFVEKFVSFITNPFVLSAILGIVFAYFRIPVLKLKVLDEILKITGNTALPLALVLIGCSIEVKHLRSNLKLVLGAAAVKLVAVPILAYILAFYIFKVSGTDLGLSIILPATPSSISTYVMAREMDTDDELAAATIGFTTFLSVLTISIAQFLVKTII